MPYKNKEQQRQYRKEYKKDKPKSAITGEYYQIYKFFETLTVEELMVLFKKRKEQCKYSNNEEIKRLRTEMAIINDLYVMKKKQQKEEQTTYALINGYDET